MEHGCAHHLLLLFITTTPWGQGMPHHPVPLFITAAPIGAKHVLPKATPHSLIDLRDTEGVARVKKHRQKLPVVNSNELSTPTSVKQRMDTENYLCMEFFTPRVLFKTAV
jgi:hypothetical protein